jgi:pimeloyl-ACP methyl ester carboxylesterase
VNVSRSLFPVCFALLALAGCRESVEPYRGAAASVVRHDLAELVDGTNVATIDHQVPHVSTVPANAGVLVHLFVRERVRSTSAGAEPRKVVLMIHGASVGVLAAGELRFRDYDWALWLARSGDFDVFMVDLQGSGRSRPPHMDGLSVLDDPCNVPLEQRSIVPVSSPPCLPNQANYPFQLSTSRSDWDELDTVVEYIRALRGVDKVALVAWSAGASRAGPYAARYTDKVESVLFFAPIYPPPTGPAARAGTGPFGWDPPIDPRTGQPFVLPQPGTPMSLTTRVAFNAAWNREVACENQIEAGIQDVVWSAIMENDAIGRTWGPEGVIRGTRFPATFFGWGWNAAAARAIRVPTLIIHGAADVTVPATNSPRLYDDLNGITDNHKLLFKVDCAGHYMQWESQRKVLHHISKQWLKHGAVEGYTTGKFFVDVAGNLIPQ